MYCSRRSLLVSALGISGLALVPGGIVAAQSPVAGSSIDPALASYLALAPLSIASLDQSTPFIYGNAQLQMETLGFALPFDVADPGALHNWIEGTYTVALPSAFRTYALNDQFEELIGFDIGQVFSGAEFGEPPDMVTVLRGEFDLDQVRSTQLAQGYQQLDVDGHQAFSLAEEADIDLANPVQQMALARLNNASVLDDGTLVYTPTIDLMRTMLAPGATLDTLAPVQQALAALDSPLITAMLVGPGAFGPAVPLDMLQPDSADDIAEFILAMRALEPAPVVLTAIVGSTPGGPLPALSGDAPPMAPGEPKSVTKFSLVYTSPEEAAIAAGQIEQRLATDSSLVMEIPWSDLLTSWSAVAVPGSSAVLLTMEWTELPRSLELLFTRDVAFITG